MRFAASLALLPLAIALSAVPPAGVPAQAAEVTGAKRQSRVSPYDGIYGPLTVERVKRFQRAHALEADGLAGPATLKALRLPTSPSLKPGMTGPAVVRLQAALDHRGFWSVTPEVPVSAFPLPEPPLPEPSGAGDWITPAPLYTAQPPAPSTPEPYADYEPTPVPTAPEGLRPNPAKPEPESEAHNYLRFGGSYWFPGGPSVPSVRAEVARGPWLARLGGTFLEVPATGSLSPTKKSTILDAHLGYDLGGGTLLAGARLDDLFAPSLVYGSLGIRVGGGIWGRHLGWGLVGLAGLHPSSAYFIDGLAAVEGRVGPLGLTAGWRVLGTHMLVPPAGSAGPTTYHGPQVGLSLQF